MTIQDIQEKYYNILCDLRKKGSLNKILLMLLLIAASLQAYVVINEKYYDQHWERFMTHGTLIFITIGIVIFWMFLVLIMNSVSFINSKQIRFLNNEFKKNLFECIRKEIPEIRDYIPNQKIHPNVYYSSKLFQRKYDDYIGDDWMQGYYNGVRFELCELHVFKLFRVFFSGVFIRVNLKRNSSINIRIIFYRNQVYLNFKTNTVRNFICLVMPIIYIWQLKWMDISLRTKIS